MIGVEILGHPNLVQDDQCLSAGSTAITRWYSSDRSFNNTQLSVWLVLVFYFSPLWLFSLHFLHKSNLFRDRFMAKLSMLMQYLKFLTRRPKLNRRSQAAGLLWMWWEALCSCDIRYVVSIHTRSWNYTECIWDHACRSKKVKQVSLHVQEQVDITAVVVFQFLLSQVVFNVPLLYHTIICRYIAYQSVL